MDYRVVKWPVIHATTFTLDVAEIEDRYAIEALRWRFMWVHYCVNGKRITFSSKEKAQEFIDILKQKGKVV